MTRQPDVKSTWIIQVSFAFASKGKKNLLAEIVVQDVIGQGNFKTVLSYFRNKKKVRLKGIVNELHSTVQNLTETLVKEVNIVKNL